MSSRDPRDQPQTSATRRRLGPIFALAGCLATAGASGARAAQTPLDGWTVKPFVIDGKFDRCNANAPTRDLGIVLFLDGRVKALVADPAATYLEAQIEVDIDLDGQIERQVPAVVVSDQLFLVALGDGQAALDRLSKASTLRIKTPAKTYMFDVSKLAGPLIVLKRCVAGQGQFTP